MKLLLDTNILIDYVGGRQPFFEDAKKIIAAGFFGDAKLWASAQSVKDAYYVLSRIASSQMAVQRALRRSLDVVSLVSLPADDAIRGLFLEWDDYEDCLVSLSAVAAKADYLVTRDEKGFARSSVPAISPSAWLDIMREEHGIEYDLANLP